MKNVGALLSGMLKRYAVQVSVLARSLEEKITPKKTEERLHRTLRREGIGRRILEANAKKNRGAIRGKRFCLIGIRDIPSYPYYMLTAAVAQVLGQSRRQQPKPLRVRKRDYVQLSLALQGG